MLRRAGLQPPDSCAPVQFRMALGRLPQALSAALVFGLLHLMPAHPLFRLTLEPRESNIFFSQPEF